MADLNKPAQADLVGCKTIAELARAEGIEPDEFALLLAHKVREDRVPLDVQRERLAALVNVAGGLSATQASADELGRHMVVLNALFDRFAWSAAKLAQQENPKLAEASVRLLSGAVNAQRAAVSVMSALQVLRAQHSGGPQAPAPASPDNAKGNTPGPDNSSASTQAE